MAAVEDLENKAINWPAMRVAVPASQYSGTWAMGDAAPSKLLNRAPLESADPSIELACAFASHCSREASFVSINAAMPSDLASSSQGPSSCEIRHLAARTRLKACDETLKIFLA